MNGYLDIGLLDTMKDLLVNCMGAFLFCLTGYICRLKQISSFWMKQLILKKKSPEAISAKS